MVVILMPLQTPVAKEMMEATNVQTTKSKSKMIVKLSMIIFHRYLQVMWKVPISQIFQLNLHLCLLFGLLLQVQLLLPLFPPLLIVTTHQSNIHHLVCHPTYPILRKENLLASVITLQPLHHFLMSCHHHHLQ